MRKIIFVNPHIIMGGVEKSLINLLKDLKNRGEEHLSLRLVRRRGQLSDSIPAWVDVSEIPVTDKEADMLLCGGAKAAALKSLKSLKLITGVNIIKDKIYNRFCPEYRGNFKNIPADLQKYDVAVCYHMHMPFIVRYTAEKITADKKYIWIHNDFKVSGFNPRNLKKYLDSFDAFFAVSKQLKDEFVEIFPEYADKTQIKYNILDYDEITSLSEQTVDWGAHKSFKILTVGRLEEQKGYEYAIEAARKLKEDKVDFIWYGIGEGSQRKKLEKLIKKYGLGSNFKLIGSLKNPYPYFKTCDIYVQPSRHEGYVTTLTEAKFFNKPIIATDFAGAREQLANVENGFIVNNDNIGNIIFNFIKTVTKKESNL